MAASVQTKETRRDSLIACVQFAVSTETICGDGLRRGPFVFPGLGIRSPLYISVCR
jgi:hypothetical protein